MKNGVHFILGGLFGLILFKSGVASHENIRAMFHFESPDLYLIIGSAVMVGMISLQVLKWREKKAPLKQSLIYPTKQMNKGVIIGGFFFGMGWYITGACPGPIGVQIGAGAWPALFTLGGAIAGTYLYARLKPKLPH